MTSDDMVNLARERACVLNASAAWGSDDDAQLFSAMADRIEDLEAALQRERAMGVLLAIDGELYGEVQKTV